MVFNSFLFFFFFAGSAIVYGLVKERYRWYVLLALSLVFYLSFGVKAILFLLFTAASTHFFALAIDSQKNSPKKEAASRNKRILITLGLVSNFGILAVVKYFNFVVGGVASLSGFSYQPISFLVPLGISFYTFQMMGYLVDVYREMVTPQRNFLRTLLFAGYFPQLLNGPINRYGEISEQLYSPPPIEYARCRNALVLFTWGLFKKICVADNLKVFVDMIFQNARDYYGLLTLAGAVAYAIYLYADFSGCIDMAHGVSSYFGITLQTNFNRPYFSTSVEEFWRKWHISLSSWFRDYLFYPLQRSALAKKIGSSLKNAGHKKAARAIPAVLSVLIVWLTTGLWHGANLTYLAWGLYYGLFMMYGILRDTFGKKRKKAHTKIAGPLEKTLYGLKIARTFLIVCIGYILFNSPTITDAFIMLQNLVNIPKFLDISAILATGISFYKRLGGMLFFAVMVISTLILILYDVLEERGCNIAVKLQKMPTVLKYILSVVWILLLLFMMNRSSGDFSYMQF